MNLPCPPHSNCLFWMLAALHLFGGSWGWRWSHNYLGPHFYWIAPDGAAWSYSPLYPKRIPWDIAWFRGRIRQERP
jgi:hypothetical protein